MRYYYREKDWIYIGFDYRPYLVTKIKKDFGAKYNPATKEWYLQLGLEKSLLLKGFLEENGFEKGRVIQSREIELEPIENAVDEELVEEMIECLNLPLNLRDYQLEGLTYMINHANCINGCSMGLGKAQPLDMIIYTEKGPCLFGDLKEGDKIFGSDGQLQVVEHIYPQGKKECYKVVFSDDSQVECCDDHLWTLWYGKTNGYKSRKLKTVSLKEIMQTGLRGKGVDQDKSYYRHNHGVYWWRLPMIKEMNFPSKETSIDPYIIGYLLGDGCLRRNRIMVTIAHQDQEEVFKRLHFEENVTWNENAKGSIDFNLCGKDMSKIRERLDSYGLMNKCAHEKEIPVEYLYNTAEVRLSILQGLIDSDGYVSKNGLIEFACVSKKLTEQVAFIAKSLGGTSRKIWSMKTHYKDKDGKIIECKDVYRTVLKLPKKFLPCRLSRKVKLLKENRQEPCRAIKSIEYVGEKEMQCIKVSNKDALYASGEDIILTHNTRQTIAFVELLDLFPCIIVCPSTVKTSWEREWKRCNPKRTLHILDSKSSKNVDWEVDVTVINYDFLFEKNSDGDKKDVKIRYGEELLKDWEALILDEVHLCKNPKALRSKAVEKIAKQSNKIVALSGAVIMNRPQEIISVLKIIGKFDKIFPDLKYFLYRYCNAKMTPFGLNVTGASYTLELNEILRHYCYFRKERREVLKELPPIIEQTIDCSITNKKEYKMAEENFIEYLEGIDIEAAEKAKNAEHLVRLTNLKRLSIKGKTKFIIQFLKDWRESDEELKLIVFGMMKEPLKELYKEFSKYSELVVGGGSTEEKMNKVENWKRDKQFLFANMETLSTGIDGLQDCCYNIVFIELPQTPTELEQATARIDRMGQVHNMNAYYLMSQETIDVETREILDYKIKITDAVNKGIDTIINSDESTDTLLIKKIKDKSRNKK